MQPLRWLPGLALAAGLSNALVPAPASPTQAPEPVVGTWKVVSAKANGRAIDLPAGITILKHVTPTHFTFVYYDQAGRITAVGGGRYTLNGSRYEETVEYGHGEGVAPLIGKTLVFSCRIEGGRWYHGGKETDGTVIEEVWERVQPVGSS
jgi:hypothetical protein